MRLFQRLVLTAWAAAVGISTGAAAPIDGAPETKFLAPQGVIVGGFSAPPAPVPGQAAAGAFVKLKFPAAIAVNGPDLYVADIGQRRLLRIDTVSRAVTALRELPPLPGVRLKTDRDGSVYVVRPGQPSVERIARDGRRLATFSAKFEVLQPADVVVGPGGRLWISDIAGGAFSFHPSGRVAEPLAGRGDGFSDEFSGATLLAAGRDGVFGIHPECRCVLAFDRDGAPIARFGEGELLQPIDLAVDAHGRVWILDRGDQRLKIYAGGQRVASLEAARLGLTEMSGLSIDVFQAYISDGPGGKIGIFAILQPTP